MKNLRAYFEPLLGEILQEYFGYSLIDWFPLGFSESLVYGLNLKNEDRKVLRLTSSSHRSSTQLAGEMKFLHELKQDDFPVPEVFPSIHGDLHIELETPNGNFHGTVFAFGEGQMLRSLEFPDWSQKAVKTWARLMARLHNWTDQKRGAPGYNRPEFSSEKDWQVLERARLGSEFDRATQNLKDYLAKLPRDGFGLIHGDLHHGNLLFDEKDRVLVIDFDDSYYNFFLYDLAVLSHMITSSFPFYHKFCPEICQEWMNQFILYYEEHRPLSNFWKKQLPYFDAMRAFHMAAYILRTSSVADEPEAFEFNKNGFLEVFG